MLPDGEQGNRISPISISCVKRPAPPIWAHAVFAVVELIAVVVNRDLPTVYIDLEVAGINLVPRFMTHLTHDGSTENRLPKYLGYLSCGELSLSVYANATYLG